MYKYSILNKEGFDHVVDVGANNGGYAQELRKFGYKKSITSFEPLSAPFAALSIRASSDPLWNVMRYAIGAQNSKVKMNIAGNEAASSSVLPMMEKHISAAPESRYVGTENVEQIRLDSVWHEIGSKGTRALLKVDVQGYEKQVLLGADQCLADGAVQGIQLEVSFTELYAGGWKWHEAFGWIASHGFRIVQIIPGFFERASGQMLQADVLAVH